MITKQNVHAIYANFHLHIFEWPIEIQEKLNDDGNLHTYCAYMCLLYFFMLTILIIIFYFAVFTI